MRLVTSTLILALVAATAEASPARSFDLVSYSAPAGWQVSERAGEVVTISRIRGNTYCMVGIYASTPASASLEASFAAEWAAVILKTVDPVEAPAPTLSDLGNTRAAVGMAATTIKGQPAVAMLVVLDAGTRVVSVMVLSPTVESFESYAEELQGLLAALSVRRAEAPVAPPVQNGKLVVPPLTRALTLADLVGEWGHEDGINTRYVDRYTGAYAGSDSLHFREKWIINAKGGVTSDFFAIRNGKKIVEKTPGTIRVSGRVIDIKVGSPALYLVRGWLELPNMTVMKIVGPFYGGVIDQDVLDDPGKGVNLEKHWVRVRPKR